MAKVDYRNILDVEYGIKPQQQQGQLERSIAEWQGQSSEQPGQQIIIGPPRRSYQQSTPVRNYQQQ
jgi:hypothetical protein